MSFSRSDIGLGLALVFYVCFCVPLLPVAADDIRLVDVFSMDEAGAVAVVRFLYRTGSFVVETFSYGGLFYHIPVLMLHGLNGIGVAVDDKTIIVVLRGVNVVAGIGCLYLCFLMGRLVGGAVAGVIAVWLLVLTPVFLRWSVEIHPDLPQLFWLLFALYACCLCITTYKRSYVVLAGVCAGLAFGTKYAGVFLLPILGLALFLARGGQWAVLKDRTLWLDYMLVLGAFVLAGMLGTFSAFWHPETFYHDVEFERAHLGFGHGLKAEHAGLSWLVDLWRLIGWGHGAVCIGGLGWLVWQKKVTRLHVLLVGWGIFFMGYLVVMANLKAGRHLLPVLPVFLVLVGYGYVVLWAFVSERLQKPVLMVGSAAFLICVCVWLRADAVETLFADKWSRAEARDEIVAGRWLGETYNIQTTMLYHAYGYVPAKFGQVFRVSSMHYLMVNHFEPDVLVVRDASIGRFDDVNQADRAQLGRDAFLDRLYFYRYLKAGLIDAYQLKRDFGAVTIYERVEQKDERRRALGWNDRMARWAQRQILDAGGAFAYMAHLHKVEGNLAEAQRLEALSQQGRGGVEKQIVEARALLAQGQVDKALALFAQTELIIQSEPANIQAAVQLAMGRALMQTGHMKKAVARAQLAIQLNPDYREAHFDLGLFLLADQQVARAHQIYMQAIVRYGRDKRAIGLLQQFIKAGIAVEDAQKILSTYFGLGEGL